MNETADKIVDAALALAAEKTWAALTMQDVAERAGIRMSELYAVAPSKHAILCRLTDKANRAVLDLAHPDMEGTPRERLFEIIMSRLDALAPYKPGLKAIANDFMRDPAAVALIALLMPPSMAWMLEAAGIPATGFDAPLRVIALTHFYAQVLRTWLKDDSEDGGKTMAELDRVLAKAESWANSFGGLKPKTAT